MSSGEAMSSKKRELLAYKAKLLQQIKYYDKRIKEVRLSSTNLVQGSDSSDSEEEFSLTIDKGPSIPQLRQQQSMLRTCLQATQELTNLQVLQSEVNVLVDDPVIEGEPPVTEPGTWREVIAECRVDLVPFSIAFFVHKPDRQFGQPSYRGLRVVPVKVAHERELSKSVLTTVTTPSDAVEVLRSYASAHRSRRTTLARLADRFPTELEMQPISDGGYILKCANLLQLSWTLQNKWSPVASFHHRMKFELEYMDESYIKIITQAHKQLLDPSIDTDERTLHLAKIISTCIEAQGPTQELYDSMSSDPENAQSLKTRRTTLDQEPEGPGINKKSEKELMAPPKSLPKKSKVKGKENKENNRKLKRGNSNDNMNGLKKSRMELSERVGPKSDEKAESDGPVENKGITEREDKSSTKQVDKASVASNKNNELKNVQDQNENEATNHVDNNKTEKSNKNKTGKGKSDKVKEAKSKPKAVNSDKPKQNKEKISKAKETGKNDDEANIDNENGGSDVKKTVSDAKNIPKSADSAKNIDKNKVKSNADKDKVKNAPTSKNKPDSVKTTETGAKSVKEKANTEKGDIKSAAVVKNKQPSYEQIKLASKESKIVKDKVASAQNEEASKSKAPKFDENYQKEINEVTDDMKGTVSNQNKVKTDNNTKNKIPPNKSSQNSKKPLKSVPSDKIDSATDKVVEKRESVASKRKNNMVEGTDNVASAKISKPESSTKNTEKNMKSDTGKNIQKTTKSATAKVDQRFKSKLIPVGIQTHTSNSKLLNNIEKQNSDKKSKIPQKKILSATSEAALLKNPLRISPRKIPSKFKTTPAVNQKTTSIPRLKKPVP